MLYFQSTEQGRSWNSSAPWNTTSCHIFLLRMDNQFAKENFTEIFVLHFAATWLVYKKCISNGHVCWVKKQFLGSLPCSAGNPIAVDYSVWLVHKPHVRIVVFYSTRFDSLPRFLSGISFNRGSVRVCQNVHIPLPLTRVSMSPLFIFRYFGPVSRGIPRLPWRTVPHALIVHWNRSSNRAGEVK